MLDRGLPALPADDASAEEWAQYFDAATRAITIENGRHPEWLEYLRMVLDETADERWKVAPWHAWRELEGNAAEQALVALMPWERPAGGRSCLAAVASVAQATVEAVVEALEQGEATGLICWDNDAQKVTARQL